MTPSPVIEFWYDFASPYSYLTAMRVPALAAAEKITIRYRPFLLGPIFAANGMPSAPLTAIPSKGRYLWRDMERQCASYGLTFHKPDPFPANGLMAARLALLGEDKWIEAFTQAVFKAEFAEGQNIADTDILKSILQDMKLNSQELLAQTGLTETKMRLRTQTDEALQRGIFGAPTFITNGELFWGNDRLEQAIAWAKK